MWEAGGGVQVAVRERRGEWTVAPPLELSFNPWVRNLTLDNAGTVTVVASEFTGIGGLLQTTVSNLAEGVWTTEQLPRAPGTEVEELVVDSNTHGDLVFMTLERTKAGKKDASVVVRVRPAGEPIGAPYTLTTNQPCFLSNVLCGDIEIDRTGDLAAVWLTDKGADGDFQVARRAASTGDWSAPDLLIGADRYLAPQLSMHDDGTVITVGDDFDGTGALYLCAVGAHCAAIPPPDAPAYGEFVAGPAGSATSIFGSPGCGEDCWTRTINVSTLVP